eukprot:PhM_4_TR18612/c0_g1_i8/m.83831
MSLRSNTHPAPVLSQTPEPTAAMNGNGTSLSTPQQAGPRNSTTTFASAPSVPRMFMREGASGQAQPYSFPRGSRNLSPIRGSSIVVSSSVAGGGGPPPPILSSSVSEAPSTPPMSPNFSNKQGLLLGGFRATARHALEDARHYVSEGFRFSRQDMNLVDTLHRYITNHLTEPKDASFASKSTFINDALGRKTSLMPQLDQLLASLGIKTEPGASKDVCAGFSKLRRLMDNMVRICIDVSTCELSTPKMLFDMIASDAGSMVDATHSYIWILEEEVEGEGDKAAVISWYQRTVTLPELQKKLGKNNLPLAAAARDRVLETDESSAVARAARTKEIVLWEKATADIPAQEGGEAPTGMYIPLVVDNKTQGVIQVLYDDPEKCNSDLAQFLEIVSPLMGAALRNSTVYARSSALQRKAEVMLNLAEQLSRDNLDEKVLVAGVMNTAKRLMDADRCSLFVVDEDKTTLTAHFEGGRTVTIPADKGIAGHVATEGEIVNIPDAYEDSRFNRDIDKATGYRTQSILCMPVMYEDQIVAVTQLINKKDEHTDTGATPFTKTDEDLFSTFSTFIGVCLRNCREHNKIIHLSEKIARDYEHVKQLQRKAEVMLNLAQQLSHDNLDEKVLVAGVMDTAKRLMDADRCSLFVVDEDASTLTAHFEGGRAVTIPSSTGIAGHVATQGETVNIPDAYEDSRFNRDVDKATGYRTQSILCMPVMYEDQIVAVTQ